MQTNSPSRWFILNRHRPLLYETARLEIKEKRTRIQLLFLSIDPYKGDENEVLFSGSSLMDTIGGFS